MFNELSKIFLNSLDGALSTQQVLINNDSALSKKGIVLNSQDKTLVNFKTGEEIKFLDSGYIYNNKFCEIIKSENDNFSINLKECDENPASLNIFNMKKNVLSIKKYMDFYNELKTIHYPDNMKDMLLCWKSFYLTNDLYQETLKDKREYSSQIRMIEILISLQSKNLDNIITESYNNFTLRRGPEEKDDMYFTKVGKFEIMNSGHHTMSLNKETRDIVHFSNEGAVSNKYYVFSKLISETIPELEQFILSEFDKIKTLKNVFYLLKDYYKNNPTYNSVNIEEIELSLLDQDMSKYEDLYKIIETVKLNGDKKCLNNYKK